MEYKHQEVEKKWQEQWLKDGVYKVKDQSDKPKFYVLDMFPYPSGAGLHVGHPLGYIASDIYARYKRLNNFNVLHPMGYDSFGLPAEQYAIQTGQHPAITTENNIKRYREQLDAIGFSYDWEREVRTSDPKYYKWTQWIFKQIYDSWFDRSQRKARRISDLISIFEKSGSNGANAFTETEQNFSSEDWNSWSTEKKEEVLEHYRLTYLSDTWVNWCPALGTVLANDEVKDGLSERGGHPVERRLMKQWSMRITAYAERLLEGLEQVDWSDALKEQQRNWIGKSTGASLTFDVHGHEQEIEVFTTRPDTIFGATFMVLAPEHELVDMITTADYKEDVKKYKEAAALKSERDRMSNVKTVSGTFTGAYAIHPFNGNKLPIWIGDYVLAGYGTGAVMAVPAGDQRDYNFAQEFRIPIVDIFKDIEVFETACEDKNAKLMNSDFLNDMTCDDAISKAVEEIEKKGIGKGKINYRLRDAVFSRQRYWGEPFPVFYEGDQPRLVEDQDLPVELPVVDKYLPTEEGEPPLARAKQEDWKFHKGDRMDYNTMPGWAGSSWYFLRYMDPNNDEAFADRALIDYWNQVDLYIGGSEHATGHLLYARFWTKILHDLDYIGFDEPFKKLINQGMILGRSSILYRDKENPNQYVCKHHLAEYHEKFPSQKGYGLEERFQNLRIDIHLTDNDILNASGLKAWQPEYRDAKFFPSDADFTCGFEVEKMSKRWYNVEDPTVLCEKFGADTLRCYEMFLGPLEQSKPWDVKGINGVHNFLRKLWRLFHKDGEFNVSPDAPKPESLKTLHKTIKKITEDIERYSFNTPVSGFMIAVNELTEQKCNHVKVLEDLLILIHPFAPHITEELWHGLGKTESIVNASWPKYDESFLKESNFSYPVSFNGKMRFKLELPVDLSKEEVEKCVLEAEEAQKWLSGKTPKKVIVVPSKIVNVVV
ncbi:MAG: leucine--tRNA ligase [Flavobacteriales bacterium]|nr:leucine--tRNA ligase [Flavobacteriales bacterium]